MLPKSGNVPKLRKCLEISLNGAEVFTSPNPTTPLVVVRWSGSARARNARYTVGVGVVQPYKWCISGSAKVVYIWKLAPIF